MASDYLNSRKGQAAQHWTRSAQRTLFHIEQEPKQKKSIKSTEKIAFQEAVLEQLQGRLGFRAPIVIEFIFDSTQPNPPALYQLPKNYLDLLWRPEPGLNTKRRWLLMKDDRQIRALFVRYHVEYPTTPSIWIKAQPHRNVVQDLELVHRIASNDFSDRHWSSRWTEQDLIGGEHDELDEDDDLVQEIHEWDLLPSKMRNSLGVTFDLRRRMLVQRYQRRALAGNERYARSLLLKNSDLWSGSSHKGTPNYRETLHKSTRGILLMPHVSLSLARTPAKEGDTAVFRSNVKSVLQAYRTARPDLFPLVTQLNVTILFVPPARGGIDLDNLARYILPYVHEVMEPPLSIWGTLSPGALGKDPQVQKWYVEQQQRLRRLPKHSLTGYSVIELARTDSDLDDGQVFILFGDGTSSRGFFEEVDETINHWKEQAG